jgi:hypothetical protein
MNKKGTLVSNIYLFSYPYRDGKKQVDLYNELKVEQHHIGRAIRSGKLVENNYIEYYQVGDKKTSPYYIKIKLDPVLDKIKEISKEKNMKLNHFDMNILEAILNSNAFRHLVKTTNDTRKEYPDPVIRILEILDCLIIMTISFKPLVDKLMAQGISIRTYFKSVIDYKDYIEKMEPIMKHVTPVLLKNLELGINQKDFVVSVRDILLLLIPYKTLNKIKSGFTFFANMFDTFENIKKSMDKNKKKLSHIFDTKLEAITKETLYRIKET